MNAFLHWLLERHEEQGGITEIRALRPGARAPLVFYRYVKPETVGGLVHEITTLPTGPRVRLGAGVSPRNGEANFYFTLNAVNPNAQGLENWRASLAPGSRAARDADILAYSLFLIDVDPVRPRGVCATDAEKLEARAVTNAVAEWLFDKGIGCLAGDSGNGYHLLIPMVPVPVSLTSTRDAQDLLKLLDAKFSTTEAKVDVSTFNASRICKLYGTLAIKGPDSPDRPHRLSYIHIPEMPPANVPLFDLVRPELEAFRTQQKQKQAPATVATSSKRDLPPSRKELSPSPAWQEWRRLAVAHLPLERIYGQWLTGEERAGWLQCRDPHSESGDKNPSAGVADGTRDAERGAFHSFRTGQTLSVFDFLLDVGQAADMKAAVQLVAELSGIPKPLKAASPEPTQETRQPEPPRAEEPPPPITDPETFLERFEAAFTGDNAQKMGALDDAMDELLRVPVFLRRNLRIELQRLTSMDRADFEELLKQARARARSEAQTDREPGGSRKPVFKWVKNADTIDRLFTGIVDRVNAHQRFFQYGPSIIFVRPGIGPLSVTTENFPGLLSAFFELQCWRINSSGDTVPTTFDLLPAAHAKAFLNNPNMIGHLPECRSYSRVPFFDTEWRWIGRPGWHPQAGIYYDGIDVPARPLASGEQGTPLIDQMLRDFSFATTADRSNFIGALLTAITWPLWVDGHPMVTINGNRPGTGKTTLAMLLAIVADGEGVQTCTFTPNDEELEKRLATRAESGAHVIIIDNVKTKLALESQVLERTITDAKPSFRRLSTNTEISRPVNDIIFCLTMNGTRLGADLRRRALPINLHLTDDPTHRSFTNEQLLSWARLHRGELVAELAGMVTAWLSAGRPLAPNPAKHSTSNLWAKSIDAILHHAGRGRLLENYDAVMQQYDPNHEWMLDVALKMWDYPPGSASDWVIRLEHHGITDRFKDKFGRDRETRAKATILGALLNEYAGKAFVGSDGTVVQLIQEMNAHTKKPLYSFVQRSVD